MNIKITPEAHKDILNIYTFILKDGNAIAKNQVELIYAGIENLSNFPNMGTALQKHVEHPTKLRYLAIHKTYIVIYDITDVIEIIRIFRKDQDFISALEIGNEE